MGGGRDVPVDEAPHGVAAEVSALRAWEERIFGSAAPFGEPGLEHGAGLLA